MHGQPTHAWTVDELGRRIGMSRSALAQCFVALLGQPPIQYLTNWRLHLAAQLLRTGNKSVAAITEEVGYDSEPAFSRAFNRAFGVPLTAFRRGESADAPPQSAAAA
ncbi:MAG: helix-turn-helix transcriptional regulator [Betaproteobacteria bacterium]